MSQAPRCEHGHPERGLSCPICHPTGVPRMADMLPPAHELARAVKGRDARDERIAELDAEVARLQKEIEQLKHPLFVRATPAVLTAGVMKEIGWARGVLRDASRKLRLAEAHAQAAGASIDHFAYRSGLTDHQPTWAPALLEGILPLGPLLRAQWGACLTAADLTMAEAGVLP